MQILLLIIIIIIIRCQSLQIWFFFSILLFWAGRLLQLFGMGSSWDLERSPLTDSWFVCRPFFRTTDLLQLRTSRTRAWSEGLDLMGAAASQQHVLHAAEMQPDSDFEPAPALLDGTVDVSDDHESVALSSCSPNTEQRITFLVFFLWETLTAVLNKCHRCLSLQESVRQ